MSHVERHITKDSRRIRAVRSGLLCSAVAAAFLTLAGTSAASADTGPSGRPAAAVVDTTQDTIDFIGHAISHINPLAHVHDWG